MYKRLVSIFLICILILSGCGSDETSGEDQDVVVENTENTENVSYEMESFLLPNSLPGEMTDEFGQEGDSLYFKGFVADLHGTPAMYVSSFVIEEEQYLAEVRRWTLMENNEWEEEAVCQNSFSEFLNTKYEEAKWERFTLEHFHRGDDGSLYGIFTYYVKDAVEEQEVPTQTQIVSLLQIDEENDQIFETPLPDFTYSEKAEQTFLDDVSTAREFTSYHVFEDGKIVFIYTDSGGEFGKIINGETGETEKDLGNIVKGRKRFVFGESELVFFSNEEKKFRVLGLPGLEEDNVFGTGLSEDVVGRDWYFDMDTDTWQMYICNDTGIYSVVSYMDSDEVQCLTGNSNMQDLTSLSEREGAILDFFAGPEEDFYVCVSEMVEAGEDEEEEMVEVVEQKRVLHYKKKE